MRCPKTTTSFAACFLLGALPLVSCKTKTGASKQSESPKAEEQPAPVQSGWARDPGKRLEKGDEVPEFSAISHTGYRVDRTWLGERPAIVYFCPAITETPCDEQTLAIRDHWLELVPNASMVFGVSSQDNVAHRDFASLHDLPFLLLSDVEGEVKKAFGVGRKDADERVTFLLGGGTEIRRVFVNPEPERHAKELVVAVQ